MKNWLGQNIEPGDIVGNTSNAYGDMKIGKVFELSGRIARVHWLYRSAQPGQRRMLRAKRPGVPAGGGPIDVDRLLQLDPRSFDFDPHVDWWADDRSE